MLVLPDNSWAKTDNTKILINNETKRASPVSMKKYMLASLTFSGLVRSISLDWNKNYVINIKNLKYLKREKYTLSTRIYNVFFFL